MWTICFPRCSGKEVLLDKFCIRIPEYRLLRLPPEPDPPWLTLGAKVIDVAQDLQILASIDGLARELSPEFRRTVQAGIEQAAHSMKEKLPEGVELHFREQTAE